MVAASKLRRAQERMMNARPYAQQMQRVLASVASRVDPSIHPLLIVSRTPRQNSTDARHRRDRRQGALRQLQHQRDQGRRRATSRAAREACSLGLVGRKGRDFFGRRGFAVLFEQVGIFQKLRLRRCADDRADGDRRVRRRAGRPRGAGLQRVQVGHDAARGGRSVAADCARGRGGSRASPSPNQVDYLYEPSPQEIFNELLPRYIEAQIYRALLESNAAFFAAQMTAMDTAIEECGRHDFEPDAVYEQGPAGGDYARDHRGGVGRPGAVTG